MTADPNARPAVPGLRSATLNAHGDIARADVAAVRTVCGDTLYVDREALAGGRMMLTQYRRDGTLRGRHDRRARTWTAAEPLHRGNIVPDVGSEPRATSAVLAAAALALTLHATACTPATTHPEPGSTVMEPAADGSHWATPRGTRVYSFHAGGAVCFVVESASGAPGGIDCLPAEPTP
jgi:hypothetical protein